MPKGKELSPPHVRNHSVVVDGRGGHSKAPGVGLELVLPPAPSPLQLPKSDLHSPSHTPG